MRMSALHFPSLALVMMFATEVTQAAPGWRIREDFAAPLNADAGWAAAISEPATVHADRPFRVRIEWERSQAVTRNMPGVILQYRRNDDEDWVEVGAFDFPYPKGEEPRSPRVSVVRTTAYSNGEPAVDLLRGSTLPFVGGSGMNLAAAASVWSTRSGHMELEWPLVIRRWVDGAVTNEAGDRFELRLADADGEPLQGSGTAMVNLAIAPRHVGGTFVETPGQIGPWRARNGDLYFIMEPAESSNLFMMIKSSDGGRSWREVDGEHRPRTDDLEAVDGRLVGDRIEVIHQITSNVFRHTFRTSDDPHSPDTWARTDEPVVSVESIAQAAALVVRSDGSMIAFHVGDSLGYNLWQSGRWGPLQHIDKGSSPFLAGPQAVLGNHDTTHLAYFGGDGTIWYRRLDASGTPGPARLVAEDVGTGRDAYGSVLPLVHLPETDTVVVMYQRADLRLYERRITADGAISAPTRVTNRAVVRQAADSQQPGADLIRAGNALQVLFIDNQTRQVFSASDKGGWGSEVLREDGVRADWIRGTAGDAENGSFIIRYIFDAGSGGGTGMNRYGEYVVPGP